MNEKIHQDLTEMVSRLNEYVNKGRVVGYKEVKEEPAILVKPEKKNIKPLRKVSKYEGHFLAVDCSTRTLKRANNWGVYLLRSAYALVKDRDVKWGYQERIITITGDTHVRRNFLADYRTELESQLALALLRKGVSSFYDEHSHVRRMFLLLDGGGYFGGDRKFRVSLYDECEKERINLLAISKNSPMLHDEKGRDFLAAASLLSPHKIWFYHPVKKANKDRHLYGDVSVVKLSEESFRVFRCDVMEYLTDTDISEILSPLTCVSEDPRCPGYPIPLWLAHEFSAPSDTMLLYYYDQVEKVLAEAGLLETLRIEELSCNFSDTLHGVEYPFRWEMIEHV